MRRALTWLLVLGWAGLIFFLSAQPAYAFPQLLWSEVLSVVIHLALYAVLMRLLLRALGGGSAPTASRMLWLAFGLAFLTKGPPGPFCLFAESFPCAGC